MQSVTHHTRTRTRARARADKKNQKDGTLIGFDDLYSLEYVESK